MHTPNVDCEVMNNIYSKDLEKMAFTEWLELGGVKYSEYLAEIGYSEFLMQGGHEFSVLYNFEPQKDLSRQGSLSCFCSF